MSINYNEQDIWNILDSNKQKETLKITLICLCEEQPDLHNTSEGVICYNCGLVLSPILSEENEHKNYSNENGIISKNNERTGMAYDPLFPVSSMSTMIAGNSKLVNINMWLSIPYEEKILLDLKRRLNEITIQHAIPNIIVYPTLVMFKKIFTNKNEDGSKEIHRGRLKEGLIAFCMYYTSKQYNINLILTQVLSIFKIDKKTYNQCSKIYYDNIGVEKITISLEEITNRICNQLNLPYKLQCLCKKIINSMNSFHIFNRYSPNSNASSVVYFINKELGYNDILEQVSITSGVSVSTIIKIYKVLDSNKYELYNNVIVSK